MIITRTPMRISLVGGGTDLPAFYRHHDGSVISMGIDKYIYITMNPRFDGEFRVSYSKTEIAKDVMDIQHDIVREVMRLFGFKGMEVVSVSDIPGEGSGLGSSSSFTVGLLLAAYAQVDHSVKVDALAENAYKIESEKCGHPVGKQDHYAAAVGQLAQYIFKKDGNVKIRSFGLLDEEMAMLRERLMLLWTGAVRSANDILAEQGRAIETSNLVFEKGLLMRELVDMLAKKIDDGDFSRLGRSVAVDWKLKRGMAKGITAEWIDASISLAMLHGAEGAKICGAGGGGFLLVVADPKNQPEIAKQLGFRQIPFKIGVKGSTVIYRGE